MTPCTIICLLLLILQADLNVKMAAKFHTYLEQLEGQETLGEYGLYHHRYLTSFKLLGVSTLQWCGVYLTKYCKRRYFCAFIAPRIGYEVQFPIYLNSHILEYGSSINILDKYLHCTYFHGFPCTAQNKVCLQ